MHLPQDVLDRLLDTHRDDLDGAARSLRKHQLCQQTRAQRRRRLRACVQGGHSPRLLRCWPWRWGTATNPHLGTEMQLIQRCQLQPPHIGIDADAGEDLRHGMVGETGISLEEPISLGLKG